MGRPLGNNLINLQLYEQAEKEFREIGYDLEQLQELEWDAGLGNGGLGRIGRMLSGFNGHNAIAGIWLWNSI